MSMSEEYYLRERVRELEREKEERRFHCPKCGSSNYSVVSNPDFRYSNTGYYGCKCSDCGHLYDVMDLCSG